MLDESRAAKITSITMLEKSNTVMVVIAHQDDETIGCGGTIAKLAEEGKSVYVIFMTDGSTGYSEEDQADNIVQTRKSESYSACAMLGVKDVMCLNNPTQRLLNNQPNFHMITQLIRKIKPEIVITHSHEDQHRDHKATFEIVKEAVWKAGESSLPELGKPHQPHALLTCEVSDLIKRPSLYVNIEDHFDKKMQAFSVYDSQKKIVEKYTNFMNGLSLVRGFESGCQRAEAFNIEKVYKVNC